MEPNPTPGPAPDLRLAGGDLLAAALRDSRQDTLATFAVYEAALAHDGLRVPYLATLNPPLWELGHIGWFQEVWIARNPERLRGAAADPAVARPPGVRPGCDALYDSSRVAHASRWHLPLPDAAATRADLAQQLDATLRWLAARDDDADDTLYFPRLALFHEDMHHEAALYMARSLGITIADPRWQPRPPGERTQLTIPAGPVRLGREGPGFAFDNERLAHEQWLPSFAIDSTAVRWRDFLPFVDDGGYEQPRWWSEAGRQWLAATASRQPRYLRRGAGGWEEERGGGWQPLPLDHAAEHLCLHEAEAWCRWAGRRLPTEAQWQRAADCEPLRLRWGDVWEWTASAFAPFAGFAPHPYRDYSAPWFDGRPVLRGASYLTQPRMRHRDYRNFFTAGRNDIAAGFRSVAAGE